MDRVALSIPLEDQNARPSCEFRILLDRHSVLNRVEDIRKQNIIGCKFAEAVQRNS
jgi:hypothetical protein